MKSSTDYKPNNQFALLLQGPPKSGKSSLVIAYMPKVYVIDCDQNLNGAFKVLEKLKADGKVEKDKTILFDYINTDDRGGVVDEVERWVRLCTLTKEALKNPDVETLCIDSLTTVVPTLIAYILKQSPPKVRLGGEPMMEIQHWQPFGTLLTRLVMMCRASGKKFVFCAHEEVVKDDVSGILQYRINMPSKLQHSFGALFTDCWRVEQVENSKQYESRVRSMSTVRLPGLGNTIGLPPELDPEKSDLFVKAFK